MKVSSTNDNIRFTMEIEEEGCLPFLDVKVQRSDNKLSFSIYRKPTHTDQYLHYTSGHHMSAKNSVVNTLVHRALTLCDQEYQKDELKHIEKALNKNGYPSNLVHKAIKNRQENNLKSKRLKTSTKVSRSCHMSKVYQTKSAGS